MKLSKKIVIRTVLLSVAILFTAFLVIFIYNKNLKKLKGESVITDTNGGVTLKLNDAAYDTTETNYIDWNYKAAKTISVTANFGDTISTNKTIVIHLDDGMKYRSYPALNVTDSDIQTQISTTDNLYSAVNSIDTPAIVTNSGLINGDFLKSSSGDLVYHINANISSVTISIVVGVDQYKFYGDKKIQDAVKVSASSSSNSSIGVVSKNVYAKEGTKTISYYNNYYNLALSTTNVPSVFPSTSTTLSYVSSPVMRYANDYDASMRFIPYYQSITYTFYYPEISTYEGLYLLNGTKVTDGTIVNDATNHKVTLTYTNNQVKNAYIYVKCIVDNITDTSMYNKVYASSDSSISVTHYDGTSNTYLCNFSSSSNCTDKFSFNLLDPSSFINKLTVKSYDAYEDSDNNTFIWGPYFGIYNDTPGVKTNQTFDFEIDPNYQVTKINLPRTTYQAYSDVSYMTTKDNSWHNYTGKLPPNQYSISKEDVGLSVGDGYYLIGLKYTLDTFPEGYDTFLQSPKSSTGVTLFGNLNSTADNATVTLYTYDSATDPKDDTNKTKTETIAKVSKTDTNNTAPSYYDSTYYFDKANVVAGDKFTVTDTLSINEYPYGTRLYIKNPKIYIRQPNGIVIDTDNISLKDQDGNKVSYDKTSHVNAQGDTIYTLSTKDFIIGMGLTESFNTHKLQLSFNVNVNNDCEISFLSFNDLLSWGGDGVGVSNYFVTDKYDMDGDGNTTERTFSTGIKSINIQPSKSIVISSKISKNGTDSLPYNENNPDTILPVYNTDNFNYEVNLKNSTDTDLSSYALYLPIPKKGMNYGTNYQSSAFSWNMMLKKIPTLPDGYHIEYATDKNTTGITSESSMSFSKTAPSDLNNVTMIKIVADKTVAAGTTDTFNIEMLVDGVSENENKSVNIWNPISNVSSSSISGIFKGNAVALKLLLPKISGFIYEDKNRNGTYDNQDQKGSGEITADLYKLDGGTYVKEEGASASINKETGEYYFSDATYLNTGEYAVKFNLPNGYNVSNLSEVDKDGFVKGLSVLENNITNLNLGFLKYDLDFDVKNVVLAVGEDATLDIENITPSYFDEIKDGTLAYKFELSDNNDSAYLGVTSNNTKTVSLKGKEAKEGVIVKASIYDKYGNVKTKEFIVKITDQTKPTIIADDQTIYTGDFIDYEGYIKRAYDYKGNDIKLTFSGDNKNVTIKSNIENNGNHATKSGVYEVTYTVKDDYGNENKKTITVTVKDAIINVNPKTFDGIMNIFILLQLSIFGIIMTVKALKSKQRKTVN